MNLLINIKNNEIKYYYFNKEDIKVKKIKLKIFFLNLFILDCY